MALNKASILDEDVPPHQNEVFFLRSRNMSMEEIPINQCSLSYATLLALLGLKRMCIHTRQQTITGRFIVGHLP